MCGLVGVYGHMTRGLENTFRDMLQLDVVRGHHSTGVAFLRRNGKNTIMKDAIVPQYLLDSKTFDKEMNIHNVGLMGHNRWATKGAINRDNAHPFHKGDIIGTHNGTLTGQHRLPDHAEYDSDSENLFHAINLLGIEAAWNIMEGAASLAYWDIKEKTLNLATNGKRPLNFCRTKDGKTLLYASEPWIIVVAAERNKIELDRMMYPKEHHVLTFKCEANGEIESGGTKLDPFVPPPTPHVNRNPITGPAQTKTGTHGKNNTGDTNKGNSSSDNLPVPINQNANLPLSKKALKALRKKEKQDRRRATLSGKAFARPGYGGQYITRAQFHGQYENCYFCLEKLEWADQGIEWFSDHEAACGPCVQASEAAGIQVNKYMM